MSEALLPLDEGDQNPNLAEHVAKWKIIHQLVEPAEELLAKPVRHVFQDTSYLSAIGNPQNYDYIDF